MKKLEEWQKHIAHGHATLKGTSWCGERLAPFDFAFQTVEHVAYTLRARDRLQPCPKCLATLVRQLHTEGPVEPSEEPP